MNEGRKDMKELHRLWHELCEIFHLIIENISLKIIIFLTRFI